MKQDLTDALSALDPLGGASSLSFDDFCRRVSSLIDSPGTQHFFIKLLLFFFFLMKYPLLMSCQNIDLIPVANFDSFPTFLDCYSSV